MEDIVYICCVQIKNMLFKWIFSTLDLLLKILKLKTSSKHDFHVGQKFRILILKERLYTWSLTSMDIHYSLDGSGFGTTFLLDIQDIGNIGAEHYS